MAVADVPPPNRREGELGMWAWGPGPRADAHAQRLAQYREELLAPFEAMRDDYQALGDVRVAADLTRLITTVRGTP